MRNIFNNFIEEAVLSCSSAGEIKKIVRSMPAVPTRVLDGKSSYQLNLTVDVLLTY
jgi:hypothetical protein